MKNYYDVLDIPKTAAPQEIKRAYFGLVKKFPPERFPEEFKEIRAAYDTLSDEKKRAEYDSAGGLPEEAALLLKKAGECRRLGRNKQAAEILQSALKTYPEYAVIKAELARALEGEGKNGLAMKLWEELLNQEPDNAVYADELALSYNKRGWRKKAVALYEKAVAIGGGNAEIWIDYINCVTADEKWDEASALCQRAITAVRKKGRESLKLYAYGVEYRISRDLNAARNYLAGMKRLMQSRPAEAGDEMAVSFALNGVMRTRNARLFPLVRELAALLPRMGDRLKDELDKAGMIHDIETLEDKGFTDLYHDLFATLINGCDCDNCKYDVMAMEYHILEDLNASRPLLNRLKREYPLLYNLHTAFFDEALRTREPEKLMYKRAKELVKHGRETLGDEDDAQPSQQTVRRESPKVGRNDPCPCGSGKKYKRCCGGGM